MFVFGFLRQTQSPTRGRSQPRTPDQFVVRATRQATRVLRGAGGTAAQRPYAIAGSRCIGLPNVYNQWFAALRSGPFEERGAIRFKINWSPQDQIAK